jgi:hypothetical protein
MGFELCVGVKERKSERKEERMKERERPTGNFSPFSEQSKSASAINSRPGSTISLIESPSTFVAMSVQS